MTAMNTTKARRDALRLTISQADRSLIDRAVKLAGKTRTDFIVEAARHAAMEILLDRALVAVSPEANDEFLKRLDCPVQPNERLRHTMRAKAPWQTH